MLLEVKTQVSFSPKRTTGLDTWDYMNAQEQTEGQCGDDSEHSGYARGLFELLGIEADTPVLLLPDRTINRVTVARTGMPRWGM